MHVMLEHQNDDKIDALGEKVDDLGRRVDGLDQNVDGLGRRVDNLDRKVDDLSSRVDNLDRKVDALGSRVDNLDRRVGDLDDRMEKGFERVDAELREQRQEMKAGFESIGDRFDRMQRMMFQSSVIFIAALIGFIATQL